MRKLCQELTKYMARAGLQGGPWWARPTARGRRCSCSHSASQPCPPQLGPRGQIQQSDWEDTSVGQSRLRRHSHSWERHRLRQHQSPSPQCPSQCQLPFPSPHDPILLISGSAVLWKIFIYHQDPMSPGAGCGEMMPHTCWRENKGRKQSGFMWMWSWVMSLHCPLAWPFS